MLKSAGAWKNDKELLAYFEPTEAEASKPKGEKMSEQRQLESAGPQSNRTFIKLRELKDAEKDKGYYKSLSKGETITGVYTGSAENIYKKQDYTIRQENGEEVVIASAGNLGSRMSQVPVGSYVEITYKGTNPLKTGPFKGTAAHNFEVMFERV